MVYLTKFQKAKAKIITYRNSTTKKRWRGYEGNIVVITLEQWVHL